MRIRNVMLSLFVVSALAFVGCEKDEDEDGVGSENVNGTDQEFTVTASMSNQAEIELGQLAATRGNHPAVKSYGQMMVTDHTMVGAELDSIAASLNLSTPDTLDAKHKQLKQTLSTVSGRTFDSIYIASQIEDHQFAIHVFEQERTYGANTRLRNFAAKHLPHLQMHLQKADSIKNVIR
jgi:putative membrane protein